MLTLLAPGGDDIHPLDFHWNRRKKLGRFKGPGFWDFNYNLVVHVSWKHCSIFHDLVKFYAGVEKSLYNFDIAMSAARGEIFMISLRLPQELGKDFFVFRPPWLVIYFLVFTEVINKMIILAILVFSSWVKNTLVKFSYSHPTTPFWKMFFHSQLNKQVDIKHYIRNKFKECILEMCRWWN